MAAILTEGLTKSYGAVTAVKRLDLTVPEGCVFGFLGPNGAGKSTTIDLLLDFVRPTAGRVAVLGHDPQAEARAVRERVGLLPDRYALYDRLTARKHVEFALEMTGGDEDPDAILGRVGLAAEAGRRVGGCSTGMRQRLALGMALAGAPDLLVLDEPASGLDPNGAREVRDIVTAEQDRGATVFFSSHRLAQVEAVCDRIGILDDGELVAVEDVHALQKEGESTLVIAVDETPSDPGLAALDGVAEVVTTDEAIRVVCTEPAVKAAAIERVEAAGASVTDIQVLEPTLEALFEASTEGEIG